MIDIGAQGAVGGDFGGLYYIDGVKHVTSCVIGAGLCNTVLSLVLCALSGPAAPTLRASSRL